MSQVLPPIFIAIAALMLAFALYAFWQSLRGLWLDRGRREPLPPRSAARMALIDEKASLLQALKELSFEHDMGKISDQDFEAYNARYRERAKQVLRDLDQQLGPFRKQAEQLAARALKTESEPEKSPETDQGKRSKKEKAKAKKAAASAEKSTASATAVAPEPSAEDTSANQAADERKACADCGVFNELDAAFCKKCGHKMSSPEAE